MRILLIAVGQRMPGWVNEAYEDYAKRLAADCRLELLEIPALKRSKACDLKRIMAKEAALIMAAIPKHSHVVALAIEGEMWGTQQVATHLEKWQTQGGDIVLLIGGPEGLTTECLARANQKWSLSKLTFPHSLVRVIVAEQLFRAWSLLNNHPYHRA